MKTLFFLLLIFPMTIFSQNQSEYVYYEDSLQGYPHPFRFYPAERRPEATNMDDVKKWITFSEEALYIACEGGQILFKVLVDEDGCYVKHFAMRGHPLPVKELSPHISSLKFTPAVQNGKPIKFWLGIPFRFCKCQF